MSLRPCDGCKYLINRPFRNRPISYCGRRSSNSLIPSSLIGQPMEFYAGCWAAPAPTHEERKKQLAAGSTRGRGYAV